MQPTKDEMDLLCMGLRGSWGHWGNMLEMELEGQGREAALVESLSCLKMPVS